NFGIAGTAAEISGEHILDAGVVERAPVVQMMTAGDDHPRRTEAALDAAGQHHCTLERVQPTLVRGTDAFHGDDRPSHGLLRVDQARVDGFALQDHRAGAAFALSAAFFGSGVAEPPDRIEQPNPAGEYGAALRAVDGERQLLVLHARAPPIA